MTRHIIILLLFGLTVAEICPDHFECVGSTCCQLLNGVYGCCPYHNAVCCPDKIHCCSENENCDVEGQRCAPKLTNPFLNRLLVSDNGRAATERPFTTVVFSGENQIESFSDLRPSRVELDESRSTKNQFLKRIKASRIKHFIRDVIKCPDGRICKVGSSCCLMETGKYGCCPYLNATCCSDMIHCCPNGYECDIGDNMCILVTNIEEVYRQSHFEERHGISSFLKLGKIEKAKQPKLQEISEIVCPNGKDHCHEGATCCQVKNGRRYGCCPYPKAVCCSDNNHCCPNGYTCDLVNAQCVENSGNRILATIPFRKLDGVPVEDEHQNLRDCPDGSSCSERETCCKAKSGVYGCCSYTKGVCCPDGIHCCPADTKCDDIHQHCIHKFLPKFFLGKISATAMYNPFASKLELLHDAEIKQEYDHKVAVKQSPNVCPDKIDVCQENATCCQIANDRYGCCPLKNAVCCSDMATCCPYRTTCAFGGCKPSEMQLSAVDFISFTKIQENAQVQEDPPNVCPDEIDICNGNETCCQISNDRYGCCPTKMGVCCSDMVTCCPHGSTCVTGGCKISEERSYAMALILHGFY